MSKIIAIQRKNYLLFLYSFVDHVMDNKYPGLYRIG